MPRTYTREMRLSDALSDAAGQLEVIAAAARRDGRDVAALYQRWADEARAALNVEENA